jgi:hypothetical protein
MKLFDLNSVKMIGKGVLQSLHPLNFDLQSRVFSENHKASKFYTDHASRASGVKRES